MPRLHLQELKTVISTQTLHQF